MSVRVFAYGSLVNRGTLPGVSHVEQGVAMGFSRAWRAASRTQTGGRCSLSVVAQAGESIEGLILTFDDDVFPAIAERERNYDALRLHDQDDVIIFRAKAAADRFGDHEHPILLSYVDTTLQGYVREFGIEGARRFMASTLGWHVPIVDDRHAPIYPRAQALSASEEALVDECLTMVDAVLTPVRQGG
ncbi:MAG: gamma-glutamylcyclotransferase [Pseudomonadota bacterium]